LHNDNVPTCESQVLTRADKNCKGAVPPETIDFFIVIVHGGKVKDAAQAIPEICQFNFYLLWFK